jgi:uncharacterized membrane protein required for colicin V production
VTSTKAFKELKKEGGEGYSDAFSALKKEGCAIMARGGGISAPTSEQVLKAMHWLDIVLLVILAILLFDGWRHGLFHYAFDFVGLGLGILAAVLFHDALADKLGCISTSSVAEIVAFVIICAVVGIAAALPGHILLEPRIKRKISSRVNRGGGLALGFIIGAALCVFIVLLMNKFAVVPPGTPLEEPSGIRQCVTTALDKSFFAEIIIKCFGSLL